MATCTLTQEAIAIVRRVHTTSIKITKRNVSEADFYFSRLIRFNLDVTEKW